MEALFIRFKKSLKSEWTHVHILRILSNQVYAGNLIQGKATTPNYKVKKKVKKEQDKWNRVDNTHEAIIPMSDFNNVQELLQMDTRTGTAQKKYIIYQVWCVVVTVAGIWSEKQCPPAIRNLFIMCAETTRQTELFAVPITLMQKIWSKAFYCF